MKEELENLIKICKSQKELLDLESFLKTPRKYVIDNEHTFINILINSLEYIKEVNE